MGIVCHSYPQPTDDFGVLWALAGIRDAAIIEHGSTGTTYFNAVVNFGAMNKQYPKGIIFTTGLEQEDVVMGGEQKLIKAVKEIDSLYQPEVISVVATAVTSLIGIDIEGVLRDMQREVKARLFGFGGGGFRGSYAYGIKEVFRTLAGELVAEPESRSATSVNIIGPTIDSFNYPSDFAELTRLLGLLNLRINAVFTNTTSVRQIRNASAATLNVVTRDLGIEAAAVLQKRFNIPYCYGLPFGIKGTAQWLELVGETLGSGISRKIIGDQVKKYGLTLAEVSSTIWRQDYRRLRVAIACPYDYALGLVRFVQEELGLQVVLVSLPLNPEKPGAAKLFTKMGITKVLITPGEEAVRLALQETSPHIFFGGADVSQMASEVPIHIRAAMPAYDYLHIYDGTPFVGFRGALFLTQMLVNLVNSHKEILA